MGQERIRKPTVCLKEMKTVSDEAVDTRVEKTTVGIARGLRDCSGCRCCHNLLPAALLEPFARVAVGGDTGGDVEDNEKRWPAGREGECTGYIWKCRLNLVPEPCAACSEWCPSNRIANWLEQGVKSKMNKEDTIKEQSEHIAELEEQAKADQERIIGLEKMLDMIRKTTNPGARNEAETS